MRVLKVLKYVFLLTSLIVTAEAATPQFPFSLAVREGFGSIAVGDLNSTLISINSSYDGIRSSYPGWGCVGEILPIPHRYIDWEAQLQWDIRWGFGIGIAISARTQYGGTSFLTFTIMQDGNNQTENNTYASHISIFAPIKVYLHKSFGLLRGFSASFSGGLGLYSARLTQSYVWQIRPPLDGQGLTNTLIDVQGRHLGSHLGVSLEYRINNRFSIVTEGQWRFGKIDEFKGSALTEMKMYDTDGNLTLDITSPTDGILYHYVGLDFSNGRMHEKLVVESLEPPWYGIDLPTDIRRAFLDLGGFTLKIGIKIGLF